MCSNPATKNPGNNLETMLKRVRASHPDDSRRMGDALEKIHATNKRPALDAHPLNAGSFFYLDSYLEGLSSFPRHHFRIPHSVENAALRRPLVRPPHSFLGDASPTLLFVTPKSSLAR
jgi:hypothetical protein